ncbi:MAG: hypothetical protein HOB05_17255 [Bacteroidetes bacterium]|nr:hypothetical protein [Bacteroidota bacterium]
MNIKMLKLSSYYLSFIVIFMFLFASCNSGTEKPKNIEDEINIENNEGLAEDFKKAQKVFFRLPSPLESAMLLKRANATYDESLLNSIKNISKYNTNKSMALNLGIYSSDLSFASLYDQTQTSINYMAAAKKMAEGLDIIDAISENTLERLESNVNDRDSIMMIISETFLNSESYLQENDRASVSALMFYGGWIEGLYIATKLAQKSETINDILAERIADERLSLDLVNLLLSKYKDNNDIQSILPDIKELKALFDKIEVSKRPSETSVNEETNITTIKSETTVRVPEDIFIELSETVQRLRNKYIKE